MSKTIQVIIFADQTGKLEYKLTSQKNRHRDYVALFPELVSLTPVISKLNLVPVWPQADKLTFKTRAEATAYAVTVISSLVETYQRTNRYSAAREPQDITGKQLVDESLISKRRCFMQISKQAMACYRGCGYGHATIDRASGQIISISYSESAPRPGTILKATSKRVTIACQFSCGEACFW